MLYDPSVKNGADIVTDAVFPIQIEFTVKFILFVLGKSAITKVSLGLLNVVVLQVFVALNKVVRVKVEVPMARIPFGKVNVAFPAVNWTLFSVWLLALIAPDMSYSKV